MRWKGWEAYADKWRNGLFGRHLTFQLEFPYRVRSVTAAAVVGNYADTAARTAFLEYSFDNVAWRPIAKGEYGPGTKEFSGTAAIDNAQVNRLWIRLRQGAEDANAVAGGSVVFQKFSFSVNGPAAEPDSDAHRPGRAGSTPVRAGGRRPVSGRFDADGRGGAAAHADRPGHGRLAAHRARGPDAEERPAIYVGYGPHLEGRCEPPARPEGLKILERDGDVFLLGEIAPAGVNNWPGAADRGVMHAVETFAERVMGYRFLYSPPNDPELFELGTAIPALDTLAIEPGLRIEEAPRFEHRLPCGTATLGLRSGSAPAFNCNHSYYVEAWAAMYAEKHPEIFIPKCPRCGGENGRRPSGRHGVAASSELPGLHRAPGSGEAAGAFADLFRRQGVAGVLPGCRPSSTSWKSRRTWHGAVVPVQRAVAGAVEPERESLGRVLQYLVRLLAPSWWAK